MPSTLFSELEIPRTEPPTTAESDVPHASEPPIPIELPNGTDNHDVENFLEPLVFNWSKRNATISRLIKQYVDDSDAHHF